MIKVILIGFAILLSQAAPINDLVKPVPVLAIICRVTLTMTIQLSIVDISMSCKAQIPPEASTTSSSSPSTAPKTTTQSLYGLTVVQVAHPCLVTHQL